MEATVSAADRAMAHVLRIQAIGLRSQAGLMNTQADTLDAMAGRVERGEYDEDAEPLLSVVRERDGRLDDHDFAILEAMVARVTGGQTNDTDGIAADVSEEPQYVVKALQRLADLQMVQHGDEEWFPTGLARQALSVRREEGSRG